MLLCLLSIELAVNTNRGSCMKSLIRIDAVFGGPAAGCGDMCSRRTRASIVPPHGCHVSEVCRNRRGFTRRVAQPRVHQTRNDCKNTCMHERADNFGFGV